MEFSVKAQKSGLSQKVLVSAGVLVVALRKPVTIRLGEQEWVIPKFAAYFIADQIYDGILAPAPCMQAQSDGPWLIISASQANWRALSSEFTRLDVVGAQPVAGLWPNAKALARWLLQKIRGARHPQNTAEIVPTALAPTKLAPSALQDLAQAMQASLASFHPWVARCPGHWPMQKLQVFRRLMRVRQIIDLRCTDNLSIDQLAAMANYSRSQFMSVFREVFGETPHSQQLERRLNFAQSMLRHQGYSVQDTTFAAGFEDRSSFSKLFRRRFGVTAALTRQGGHKVVHSGSRLF